jgi:hypothetical protein
VSEITNVEPQDPTKKNSPIVEKDEKGGECYWNGTAFSQGAQVCSGSAQFVCSSGSWVYGGRC